jgi:hypothetical protein
MRFYSLEHVLLFDYLYYYIKSLIWVSSATAALPCMLTLKAHHTQVSTYKKKVQS